MKIKENFFKIGFWICLLILVLNLAYRIYSYRHQYSTKYDPIYWEDRYLRSQWVVPNSQESIGDDGLYAYVGWEYIHGRDPTSINAEMPPLGKYLLGLTILFFANENIFSLGCGLLVLFAFYKLNKLIFKKKFWALLPVLGFSFEPLFWQQLRAPYLDLLYLLFLILVLYFFLRRKRCLSAIFLGLMMATKASSATFVLVALATSAYLMLSQEKELLKKWIITLPVSLLVFTLTYFRYFYLGNSLISFFGVQKWILYFYAVGAKGSIQSVWQMLLTGRWITWWNGIVDVSEWWLGWPAMLIIFINYWFMMLLKRKNDPFLLLASWTALYLIFLSFIPVWPRYLLLVIPFLYNSIVWCFLYLKNISHR